MRRFLLCAIAAFGAVLAAAAGANAAPILFTLSDVTFAGGGTASGSFDFNPLAGTRCSTHGSPCGLYSNVDVVTTAGGGLAGTTYTDVCGDGAHFASYVPGCIGVSPDSTEALFLTSMAGNQKGKPGLAFFFTGVGAAPPKGLTARGGTIDISNGDVGVAQEGICSDAACAYPKSPMRFTDAGAVVGSVPEPAGWGLMLAGLAGMSALRGRRPSPRAPQEIGLPPVTP